MSAVIRPCGPRERVEGKKARRATASVAVRVHTPEGRLHSRVSQVFVSWSWHVCFPLAGERRGWPGEGERRACDCGRAGGRVTMRDVSIRERARARARHLAVESDDVPVHLPPEVVAVARVRRKEDEPRRRAAPPLHRCEVPLYAPLYGLGAKAVPDAVAEHDQVGGCGDVDARKLGVARARRRRLLDPAVYELKRDAAGADRALSHGVQVLGRGPREVVAAMRVG